MSRRHSTQSGKRVCCKNWWFRIFNYTSRRSKPLPSKAAHFMFLLTKPNPLPILFPMASFTEPFYLRPYITSSLLILPWATNGRLPLLLTTLRYSCPMRTLNIVCTPLQGHLWTLSTYFEQWKIKINALKTQEIYLTRWWAPRKLSSTNISIGGHPIPWSTEVKYLDKRLKSIEKSGKAFRILYLFLNRKSRQEV
jgi:hypothetical protein